jgi:hypothetical protein
VVVHCCAKCRKPLAFLTLGDGSREATCCALRYVVDPDIPCICYVALWHDQAPGENQLGVLDLRDREYGIAREQILDGVREAEGHLRDII